MTKPIDPKRELREYVSARRSVSAAARDLGISVPYLHDILNSNRGIGPKVLAGLGIEAVTTYRKVKTNVVSS